MSYIAWDTETTGLPMSRVTATKENLHIFEHCRIISLAFVSYSTRGRELCSYYSVVYPDTFQVAATEIHGITHEYALEHGRNFVEIYNDFVEASRNRILVAHNSSFDKNVFFSECYRRGLSVEPFEKNTFICTLELTKEIYLKPKKLAVLYNELTGRQLENAHNAIADARACGEVYIFLRDSVRTMKPNGIPRVILKASEVAGMIGANRFKQPREILENLWHKYSPKTFNGKTKEQVALETISKSSTAMDILEDAKKFKSIDSNSVRQKNKAIENQLNKIGFSECDYKIVSDYIRSKLYTNHGILHEERTVAKDTSLKTDDEFYTYEVCTIEGTRYDIVGRIDRIAMNEDGSRTVVEIKNRTNGLFMKVRDYEDIQCQTYMEMLNIDTCKLIERYNEKLMKHRISRDKEYWNNTILPKLKNFCECFHSNLSLSMLE